MIVQPVPHGLDLLKSDLVRSPGLHASDLYNGLFKKLYPSRYDFGDAPPHPELLAMGTAWEVHLEKLLLANGWNVVRPPEFMSPEGIAYSPDLLIFNGVTRLGEIKWTSKSAKDMPTEECATLPIKLDKYLAQMKLYAYWLNLRHGWLAILFMYEPRRPDLRTFNLTWTERELQENYQMHMNYAYSEGLLK